MINWKVRIKNKTFWIALIPAVLLIVKQILDLFGIDVDFTGLANQLIDIVETLFLILSILGIVADPTTKGLYDSKLALTYEEPKEDTL